MNILISWLSQAGAWLTPWLNDIAVAIVASLLVVFGNDINRTLRRLLTGHHFVVRTLVFVAINAFGYGAFIITVSPWLATKNAWLAGTLAVYWFGGHLCIYWHVGAAPAANLSDTVDTPSPPAISVEMSTTLVTVWLFNR